MPRIELRDPYGTSYRCDTHSPDVIRAWLDDLTSVVQFSDEPDMLAIAWLYPMWPEGDRNPPDWPPYPNLYHPFPVPASTEGILAAIEAERVRLTAEAKEKYGDG